LSEELASALRHLASAIERSNDLKEQELEFDKKRTLQLGEETWNMLVLKAHSESEEELEVAIRQMLRDQT